MNKDWRHLYIVLSIVIVILAVLVFGFFYLLNKPVSLLNDIGNLTSTVESKHSDEDIVDYVKETHGIHVVVLENTGAKKLKNDQGGIARVKADDGTEFEVTINSFGAISGDTYTYEKGRNALRQFVESHQDLPYVLGDVFTEATVVEDSEAHTLYFHLTIDDDFDLVDQALYDQLYEAYQIVQRWNQDLREKEELRFKDLQIAYFGEDKKTDKKFTIKMHEKYDSVEDFKEDFIDKNEADIFSVYHQAALDELENYVDDFPEDLKVEDKSGNLTLRCQSGEDWINCTSYTLYLQIDSRNPTLNYYYKEELREQIVESVTVIKEIDLPLEKVVVEDLVLPKNLADQHKDLDSLMAENEDVETVEGTFELKDFDKIKKSSDIIFVEYE